LGGDEGEVVADAAELKRTGGLTVETYLLKWFRATCRCVV
jgi:hypothetical protein